MSVSDLGNCATNNVLERFWNAQIDTWVLKWNVTSQTYNEHSRTHTHTFLTDTYKYNHTIIIPTAPTL